MAPFSCELEDASFYGFLTKSVLSGSLSRIQKELTYCYLNFRPIDLPKKIKKLLQDFYKQFNPASNICIVFCMLIADGGYDVNIAPDKREVCIKNEPEMLAQLKVKLTEWFEEQRRVKVFDAPITVATPLKLKPQTPQITDTPSIKKAAPLELVQ